MTITHALTLHQPWASLLAHGVKRYETRSWRPTVRILGHTIAIHAGRRPPGPDAAAALTIGSRLGFGPAGTYPLGCLVGVIRVTDALPTTAAVELIDGREAMLGDFRPFRWAWRCDSPRPLPDPIPVRGYQGCWPLPADVAAQLADALR